MKEAQSETRIQIPEESAAGQYCNFAIITHSKTEFIIDFIQKIPNPDNAIFKARTVMTPEHTERFLNAFQDNFNKFKAVQE